MSEFDLILGGPLCTQKGGVHFLPGRHNIFVNIRGKATNDTFWRHIIFLGNVQKFTATLFGDTFTIYLFQRRRRENPDFLRAHTPIGRKCPKSTSFSAAGERILRIFARPWLGSVQIYYSAPQAEQNPIFCAPMGRKCPKSTSSSAAGEIF